MRIVFFNWRWRVKKVGAVEFFFSKAHDSPPTMLRPTDLVSVQIPEVRSLNETEIAPLNDNCFLLNLLIQIQIQICFSEHFLVWHESLPSKHNFPPILIFLQKPLFSQKTTKMCFSKIFLHFSSGQRKIPMFLDSRAKRHINGTTPHPINNA